MKPSAESNIGKLNMGVGQNKYDKYDILDNNKNFKDESNNILQT